MTNKEKFLKLVSNEETDTFENISNRIANRAMLRESQRIAMKALIRLEELGLKQKQLAEKMGVSPQQINKIVKGGENLTLETIVKLQDLLEIPILATYKDKISLNKKVVSFQSKITIDIHQLQALKYSSSKNVNYDFSKKYVNSQSYKQVVNEY